jgi:PAS domain-containing protein
LKGADALALSSALDGLSDRGVAFQLKVHDSHGRLFVARGRAVGSMAAVWLEEHSAAAADQGADYKAILDALPVPVWLRDKGLALAWGNHAFLKGAGAKALETARREHAPDKANAILRRAPSKNTVRHSRRFSVVGGERRALAFTEIPLGDAGVIGTALDVTEVAAAEAKLQQHADAHADTLDKLQTAVAIFGEDQQLSFYNKAFVKLWGLPESLLDKHPGDGEILDRLREGRKLPEQADFRSWKASIFATYRSVEPQEHWWYLPDGRTLRVVTNPNPQGGVTYLFDDVSERFLQSDYNTLIKVQSATLNTPSEGVAVFGLDGKLKLHNAAFIRIWEFDRDDLEDEPHVRTIAALSRDKFGDSAIWDHLIQAIVQVRRRATWGMWNAPTVPSVAGDLAPCPMAPPLVTFKDVTDRFRIGCAARPQ